MKNELFSIGPFTIYGYGLMIAIGILAAYLFVEHRAGKKGLDPDKIFGFTICCVIGGFLGSKLLYFTTILDDLIRDPSIFMDVADGWVVYGGIIGGILTAIVYCKIQKMEFLRYLDIAMPGVALAQGFGRIGCLFAGCCYGMHTDGALAITFTESSYAPNDIPLVPTQIISSGLNFLHFAVLLVLARVCKAPGQIGGFYLIFYSIGRFVMEFFRGDLQRGSVGILSTSQFISIFTLAAGVALVMVSGKIYKRK